MKKTDTSENILKAAMSLFAQKGYNAVTTKEIAKNAGTSEMTIFRHFGNKRNLFEKAYDKYLFSPTFKSLFENNLEWDIEKDLLNISFLYQEMLSKNEKIILLQFKDKELTAELETPLKKFPIELKKLLVEYFSKMKEKGILKENPEIIAINFLAVNFGIFMYFLITKKISNDIDKKACVSIHVKIFTKGITS